jgi:hypothetical protein
MSGGTKFWLAAAAVLAAVVVLFPLLKIALGLVHTVVSVAVGLFWLAVLVAAAVFVIGLVRRMRNI